MIDVFSEFKESLINNILGFKNPHQEILPNESPLSKKKQKCLLRSIRRHRSRHNVRGLESYNLGGMILKNSRFRKIKECEFTEFTNSVLKERYSIISPIMSRRIGYSSIASQIFKVEPLPPSAASLIFGASPLQIVLDDSENSGDSE